MLDVLWRLGLVTSRGGSLIPWLLAAALILVIPNQIKGMKFL